MTCPTCQTPNLTPADFHRVPNGKDGRDSICRRCRNARKNASRAKNRGTVPDDMKFQLKRGIKFGR